VVRSPSGKADYRWANSLGQHGQPFPGSPRARYQNIAAMSWQLFAMRPAAEQR